ncbi:MAG: hypothetical protein DI586_10760 [Micavibrio aeruginosavorus]|uniref:Uncharacterized protein n=1 Tax=Micavibrio aeruginosavorus TaxID=349221 RepID=A0A2W5FC56_9BACT|nr:MAG: hypothetical protein DI586_10760 [Micavibrio aeruginosavorus]
MFTYKEVGVTKDYQIPDLQEALDDAWAKARTLKAQPNVAAIDPDRALFLDMLLHFPAPWNYQDKKDYLSQEEQKFFDYFISRTGKEETPVEKLTTQLREEFMTRSVGIAVSYTVMPHGASVSAADKVHEELRYTDPEFQIWMGNSYVEQMKKSRQEIIEKYGLEPN